MSAVPAGLGLRTPFAPVPQVPGDLGAVAPMTEREMTVIVAKVLNLFSEEAALKTAKGLVAVYGDWLDPYDLLRQAKYHDDTPVDIEEILNGDE